MNKKRNILIIIPLTIIFVVGLFLSAIPVAEAGGGASNLQTLYWRFRDDNYGLAVNNGWLTAAENQQATGLAKNTTYRVRINFSEEGTKKITATQTLEYGTNSDCSSGTWTPVANAGALTTEHFVIADSTQFAENDAITANLLTASEPTWTNGEGKEYTAAAGPFTWEIDEYNEIEYSFQITSNATNGGTYYLRGDSNVSYTTGQCASLTVETPAGITVSGGCFTDETESTPCTDDGTNEIKVAINGEVDGGVDTTVDGDWTFNIGQPSSGDILTFFINGEDTETEEATTVIKYDGSGDVDLVKMYQSQLVIGADSGSANTDQTISVADMDTTTNGYENSDDEDVLYDVTAGADLTVDASANKTEQLYIISGDIYQPASGGGSDTTTENLEIDTSAVITANTNAFTVSGNWNNNGTFTANTSTITFTAADTGNTIDGGSGATYNNLTFIGSDGSGTWTVQNDDFTVSGTIDVDTSDILTIDTSRTLTHTGATMTLDGDIVGAGTLRFTNASGGPGAGAGTLSAVTRFDASAGNIASTTFDARTYSGLVEIFSDNSAGAAREVAMANASYTLSGATSHLYVINDSATYALTLDGTLNPTVVVGGDLDFTGTGASSEIITSGTGTWTVSGNVNFTDGTYTATAGNTLVMDGTGTLTTDSETLENLTINSSGTVTLAAATHTVGGNLVLGGSGTPTVTGSTITMTGTSNTITGGGKTLNILNIDPASAGTITLQTSALTAASTLTVAAGDELAIDTTSLTHTDSSDVAGTGNITGSGTLIFTNVSGGPGTGITTLSSVVRFDATAGNVLSTTFDARTYSGQVEMYSGAGAGAARSVALAASTYTISGATSHLYIINDNDTYTLTLDGALNPTVNIEGDLDFTGTGASDEEITTGTGTWTVTGNINLTDGNVTFTGGNIFQVNGTSKTITSAGEIFQGLSVTGTGDVSNADLLTVAADFSIGATAAFTHGNNVDFLSTGEGVTAFAIEDGGTFDSATAGTGKLIFASNDMSFEDKSTGTKQNMGNVQIGNSPGTTKLKSDFAAASLTILTGDVFETHGWEVDLSGAFDCQGTCTFDLENDVPSADPGDPTTVTFGGNWTMSATGTFIPFTNSVVSPDGTADQTITTNSKAFWDFYVDNAGVSDDVDDVIVTGAFTVGGALTVNDGELDLTTNDPVTDVAGNVSITSGAEINASDSSSFNAAGSWDNNGTFTSNSGTVTFDSSTGSETIEAGSSSFGVVIFNHASGDWTIQTDNMTTSGNLTLTAATSFSVASVTLEVQGNLDLSVADGATTWTGSTLYLNGSGGMYNINNKTHGGDTFITLRIGATEDIAMWDSDATTFTIDGGGCLFSQDHAASSGRLNIYGTCTSRANEYWSYAKDFEDGAAVTRQADVRFADGASLTVDDSDTLEIKGQNATTNRILVSRISTGTYGLTISSIIDAQYYDFDYLNASGLNITGTATVTELSDGSFDNAGAASASYITVTGITSDDIFRNNIFDDNGDGSDANVLYNVNADGANILWKFLLWDGNKGGESFDNEANSAIVDWSENLSFSISDNIMNLGTINTLIVGSDSHDLTVTTNATNGYTCSAEEDGNLDDITNTYDIDDVGDGTVTAGVEEYGVSCSGADCQLGSDTALTGVPLTVASNAGRVTASATAVTYKAAADGATTGTSYSHIVTYTCAGDF